MQYTPLNPQKPIQIKQLVSVHYFEYPNNYKFEGEAHDFWEFLYVDKGEVCVLAGEKTHTLKKGEIIFHAPNEFHNVYSNGVIAPNLVVASFVCNSEFMKFFNEKIFAIDNDMRIILARVVAEASNAFSSPLNSPNTSALVRNSSAAFGAEQTICNCIEQLLIDLIRRKTKNAIKPIISTVKTATRSEFANEIIRYLNENINKRLSLSEICKDNIVGHSYLQKTFKEATGSGVMEYFGNMKVEKAKVLMREGSCNFTEIAAILGYNSVHYFSRHFKKTTGMTASEYAQSLQSVL